MDMIEKQTEEQMQTGLLIGILITMVLMVVAVLATIYMYYHPTSSASLFFIEVNFITKAYTANGSENIFFCTLIYTTIQRFILTML